MKKVTIIITMFFFHLSLSAPAIVGRNTELLSQLKLINEQIRGQKELARFLDSLRWHETGDNTYYPYHGFNNQWVIVNSLGAKGAYQMTDIALKDIGYTGTTYQFLHSKQLQNDLAVKYLKRNKQLLNIYVKYEKYIGQTIHGVLITESGLFAASWLAGFKGVGSFLKSGYNATDGNETVRSYLKKFQNFNLKNVI
jgi:hypothetical protein